MLMHALRIYRPHRLLLSLGTWSAIVQRSMHQETPEGENLLQDMFVARVQVTAILYKIVLRQSRAIRIGDLVVGIVVRPKKLLVSHQFFFTFP